MLENRTPTNGGEGMCHLIVVESGWLRLATRVSNF
ncbi:hypothetical protein V6Z12_A08G239100 [Gossypium hirsutum]